MKRSVWRSHLIALGTALMSCLCIFSLSSLPAWAATISSTTVFSPAINPLGITLGPDGNLWYTQFSYQANAIGRITPSGTITNFIIPTASSEPRDITAGPDGNLWFTESETGKIGRITTSGTITEFTLPSGSGPEDITTGPDGSLWFTDAIGKIGRITTNGTITEFTISTCNQTGIDCLPTGITAGPDGNLWFTEALGNKIGRITTGGTVTEFANPNSNGLPEGITAGPDGNLWFADANVQGNGDIGRITTSGTVTEYPIQVVCGDYGCAPYNITVGPDGNLWYTLFSGNIGSIATNGTLNPGTTTSSIHGAAVSPLRIGAQPYGITAGPNNTIWYTESHAGAIVRATLS